MLFCSATPLAVTVLWPIGVDVRRFARIPRPHLKRRDGISEAIPQTRAGLAAAWAVGARIAASLRIVGGCLLIVDVVLELAPHE